MMKWAVVSVDQIRNVKFSFVMQHSGQKYTIRMFTAIDELAETNAYNIYRCLNSQFMDNHLFHTKFRCQLARGMIAFASESCRSHSAGVQFSGGLTIK